MRPESVGLWRVRLQAMGPNTAEKWVWTVEGNQRTRILIEDSLNSDSDLGVSLYSIR